MAKKELSSPFASGGAGTLFEYRVAAIVFGHLLSQTLTPGLQVPVVEVGLQQRVRGHLLDDVVVYAEGRTPYTEFQVKRTLKVTASDSQFVDVLEQALHVLAEKEDLVASGKLALGVVARENAAMNELEELAEWAQGHAKHDTFFEMFVPKVVDEKYRTRLQHVEGAVAAAIARGAPDLGGAKRATHAFLAALHVWPAKVSDNGLDFKSILDCLQPIAEQYETTALSLFGDLAALAQNWGPVGLVVDAEWVTRRLHRRGLKRISDDPAADVTMDTIVGDAVVRGPLAHLDLRGELDEAEGLLTEQDPASVMPSRLLPNVCGLRRTSLT
jgi:hypothetical protein